MPIGLNGKHKARANRPPIKKHRTRPAYPVLAANMRARQTEFVPQKIAQEHTRLNAALILNVVDGESDLNFINHILLLGHGRKPLPTPGRIVPQPSAGDIPRRHEYHFQDRYLCSRRSQQPRA